MGLNSQTKESFIFTLCLVFNQFLSFKALKALIFHREPTSHLGIAFAGFKSIENERGEPYESPSCALIAKLIFCLC